MCPIKSQSHNFSGLFRNLKTCVPGYAISQHSLQATFVIEDEKGNNVSVSTPFPEGEDDPHLKVER